MSESPRTNYFLIVEHGSCVGDRMNVDRIPKSVGRGRDSDLVLSDPCVSRRHLEVVATDDGVRVTACPGTKPFVFDNRACDVADLGPNERIIVGDTVLRVAVVTNERPEPKHSSVSGTSIHTLLSGAAMDVRGPAAIFALVEALDAARDIDEVKSRVADWSRGHAEAKKTVLVLSNEATDGGGGEALPSDQLSIGSLTIDGNAVVSVPLHGTIQGRLTCELTAPPARVTESLQRLLVVAGRICGSRLGQLRAINDVAADRDSLRRLAVGSANTFLGSSLAAQQVGLLIPRLAASDAIVLLTGETGSGKTFVARLVHESSARAAGPLKVINCAAIPESLLESELFGHERGAFTGAISSKAGALEAAGKGTLLLDEIGELPLASQAKLLRVLEEKRFERVGSNRSIALEARVIAATNSDLQTMIKEGKFRSDLYFRISVFELNVPPLRERVEDIPALAHRILADLLPSVGRRVDGFSSSAMKILSSHNWPGNVRELRNVVEAALVLSDGQQIEADAIPEKLTRRIGAADQPDGPFVARLPLRSDLLERRNIEAALRATSGNRTRAAELLGVNRATLYNKLR